jgi:hypothetical protein
MPTPIRLLVVFLVTIGTGTVVWGFGGLAFPETPLIQYDSVVYMDSRGAIGIGAGALAGAASAAFLFRSRGNAVEFGKPLRERDELT